MTAISENNFFVPVPDAERHVEAPEAGELPPIHLGLAQAQHRQDQAVDQWACRHLEGALPPGGHRP
eukprot:4644624-Alexandrium_andersonii.AAC.1